MNAATKEHRPPICPKAAAEYTGYSEGYLKRLRVRGGGPVFLKNGSIRYSPDDLDAWLESLKQQSTAGTRKGIDTRKRKASVEAAA